MMSTHADRMRRFKKTKSEVKDFYANLESKPLAFSRVNLEERDSVVFEEIRKDLDSRYDIDLSTDSHVSQAQVDSLLAEIENAYHADKLNTMFVECQNTVLENIIRPFGLGRVLFENKNGGNVSTIHNAQQGIYASDADGYNRENYTNTKNSEGKRFAGDSKNSVGSQFTRKQLYSENNLTDAYTGKKEKGSSTSPDHIASLSEFHQNGGFMLDNREKADFATDENNLASTRRDINQSMKDEDKMAWLDKKQGGREQENVEHYGVDRAQVEKQYARGKETAKKHEPTLARKAEFYATNAVTTGVAEGARMGLQQAMGVMLEEFVRAVFFEVKDIWSNGFKGNSLNDGFFAVMKERLSRIASKVASRWKDVCVAFKDGAISGFFSNIITVIINLFKTTSGKIVRIIREGFMSFLKAVKMLLFPPEGMTWREAAHAASKILVGGAIVAGGLMIEEVVEKAITTAMPFLAPFARIIVGVLVGLATGLATVFAIWLLDKADIFGVERENKHRAIVDRLEEMTEAHYQEALKLAEVFEPPKLLYLE